MSRLITRSRPVVAVVRWPLGMLLVSWRYLWFTTPLHRSEQAGDHTDLPPALPPGLVDERSQTMADGVGALWHRRFEVCIAGSRLDAATLIDTIAADLNAAGPTEAAVFRRLGGRRRHSRDGNEVMVGEEYVVKMPTPWDGPVRVVHREVAALRLATLRGHLEAGQVEFRARDEIRGESDGWGTVVFTVESWTRCGSRLVNLLYARLHLAKEIQFNMWVRYCLGAARVAGGRPRSGVTVGTRHVEAPDELQAAGRRERTGS